MATEAFFEVIVKKVYSEPSCTEVSKEQSVSVYGQLDKTSYCYSSVHIL